MADILRIEILSQAQVTPELDEQIDRLDHLAFHNESDHDDPEFNSIQWSSHDWVVLSWLGETLVSQLFLIDREILVGSASLRVAGVGGVATHPDYQHRGFGSQVQKASAQFMQKGMKVPFGLLICADETIPFYEKSGWKWVAPEMFFTQDNQPRRLETAVMILPLSSAPWPTGNIDLCGLPW